MKERNKYSLLLINIIKDIGLLLNCYRISNIFACRVSTLECVATRVIFLFM